jgi:hypothetical protein
MQKKGISNINHVFCLRGLLTPGQNLIGAHSNYVLAGENHNTPTHVSLLISSINPIASQQPLSRTVSHR